MKRYSLARFSYKSLAPYEDDELFLYRRLGKKE